MFDMSWGEVLLIGGVALIVIGPKDLPRTLRMVGQTVGKIRRMASEFQGQFNDAMREADLEDAKKEIEGLNRQVASATQATFNPIKTIRDEIKGSIDRSGTPAPAAAGLPQGTEPSALAAPSEPEIALPEAAPETAIATTAAEISGAAPDPLSPATPPEALLEGSPVPQGPAAEPASVSEPVTIAAPEMVSDPEALVTPAAVFAPAPPAEPSPLRDAAPPTEPVAPVDPVAPAPLAKPGASS